MLEKVYYLTKQEFANTEEKAKNFWSLFSGRVFSARLWKYKNSTTNLHKNATDSQYKNGILKAWYQHVLIKETEWPWYQTNVSRFLCCVTMFVFWLHEHCTEIHSDSEQFLCFLFFRLTWKSHNTKCPVQKDIKWNIFKITRVLFSRITTLTA